MTSNTFLRWASETERKIRSNSNRKEIRYGDGNKEINEGDAKMNEEKINLGIVVAEFNYDITYAMLELAKEHAIFLGARIEKIVKVPGVFDIPLALKKLLEISEIDAVITLGAVVEGQTEHDEIIAQHASRKIVDLSIEYGKPVGLGISGPGMSRLEAHERVEYAKRAVEAAVKMVKRIRGLSVSNSYTEGEKFKREFTKEEENAFAGLRAMG